MLVRHRGEQQCGAPPPPRPVPCPVLRLHRRLCLPNFLAALPTCLPCLPARPAGDQEVLSLEEYRGVGKLKGKASGGSRTLRQLISAGASTLAGPAGPAADQSSHPPRPATQHANLSMRLPTRRCHADWGATTEASAAVLSKRLLLLSPCVRPLQVAIVTGGDSGIGRSVALLMAKEGAKAVAIVHLPKEQAVSWFLSFFLPWNWAGWKGRMRV